MAANLEGNTAKTLEDSMVTQENWGAFTKEEHLRWSILFKCQSNLLKNRAADEVLDGMKKLNICDNQIPKFSEINKVLGKATNFSVIPVTGMIPPKMFFKCLANRQFPSTCFLRKPEEMDYLQEPDIFHDVFGHVPLLVNPVFADLMQVFGQKGLQAVELDMYDYAAALYWFTIEFGLIETRKGLRIYGAGITSSKGESIYCLESKEPLRLQFHPIRAMKTQYRIDRYQRTYFVIRNYKELLDFVYDLNWHNIAGLLQVMPKIEEGIALSGDEIY
ncbi:MAG: phenylalanine 4-monooxygenase [Bdellovibrionota bacterium]